LNLILNRLNPLVGVTNQWRIFLFCTVVLVNSCLSACNAQCEVGSKPYQSGEQLDYVVYYNLKKIWVPAGKVRFAVQDSMYRGISCYHFNGLGKTFKEYDWIFRVRDQYQSWSTKDSLKPQRFIRNAQEGSSKVYFDYSFNHPEDEIYLKKSRNAIKQDTIHHTSCAFDLMTLVYYARTLDFSKAKLMDTIPLTIILDGQKYDTYIRFTGRGIEKSRNGTSYKVIKFRPMLIEGTIFKGGEDMEVSVSDDKNRIPIYVEASILIGKVKVYLDKMSGVKFPMEARLKKP
jgi:hypothetical protein